MHETFIACEIPNLEDCVLVSQINHIDETLPFLALVWYEDAMVFQNQQGLNVIYNKV